MPRIRQRKPNTDPPETDVKPLIDIPEEEQWRLINESGVLHKINSNQRPSESADSEYSLMDEILDTNMIIIPFCSILLLMDILIHNQYGRHASFKELFDSMSSRGPSKHLAFSLRDLLNHLFTLQHKRSRSIQLFLFILSCAAGMRLMYLIALGSWLCPPLATIWIYTALELDLVPTVISLMVTASFVWWKGLQRYLFS
ncbi:hypothetical protein EV368DRAFT_34211 [Lentinula lateritia]|uniref:Uncharacterized protein n=1 Tax=Lentinula aff. lateritia TaxID=2804960 RepID=A0ACC1U553_9AGAR|nr:hypothetical protein F5876DRAFT_38518 [Lentinula aff. lateritia]KAJ3855669.1 hypothetical protein EV368DRAFT_34211 [Lentinula lateritia]